MEGIAIERSQPKSPEEAIIQQIWWRAVSDALASSVNHVAGLL